MAVFNLPSMPDIDLSGPRVFFLSAVLPVKLLAGAGYARVTRGCCYPERGVASY